MASTFSCGVCSLCADGIKVNALEVSLHLVTGPDIHCVSIYCGLLPSWSWGCTSPSVGTVGFLSPSTFSLLFCVFGECMLIHNDQFCCKIHKLSSELGRIHQELYGASNPHLLHLLPPVLLRNCCLALSGTRMTSVSSGSGFVSVVFLEAVAVYNWLFPFDMLFAVGNCHLP